MNRWVNGYLDFILENRSKQALALMDKNIYVEKEE